MEGNIIIPAASLTAEAIRLPFPLNSPECKPSGGESLAYRFLIGLYGNLCREEEGSAVGITDIIVIVSLRKRRCPADGGNMITAGTVVGWAAVKRPGSLVSGKTVSGPISSLRKH